MALLRRVAPLISRALMCAGAACATTPPPSPRSVEAEEDLELNRLLAELEAERVSEERSRSARMDALRPLLTPPTDVPMPDRWRARAVDLGELARLAYEATELDTAILAVQLAVEASISAGDGALTTGLNDFRVLVHRFVALEHARAGRFDEAERALLALQTAPNLSEVNRADVSTLKQVVDGMRGVTSEQDRAAAVQVAAADILRAEASRGASSPRSRSPELERFDLSSAFRGSMSERLAAPKTELSEAELPSVNDSPAAETGNLDPKTILAVVTANRASVRACYNRAMKGGSIRGKLEVEAKVIPLGTVEHAEILTTQFQKTPVGECIRDAITRWRFPPFQGEEPRTVELPFVLDTMGF